MTDHNSDNTELINICSFKLALNSLKCLGQYDIDNLTRFMDTNNEGYISIGSFVAAVGNASNISMGASFRSTKSGRETRSNKWTSSH